MHDLGRFDLKQFLTFQIPSLILHLSIHMKPVPERHAEKDFDSQRAAKYSFKSTI